VSKSHASFPKSVIGNPEPLKTLDARLKPSGMTIFLVSTQPPRGEDESGGDGVAEDVLMIIKRAPRESLKMPVNQMHLI
jgi:hypothetical protein